MFKASKTLISLAVAIFLFCGVAKAADTVSINDLIEKSQDLSGKTVTITAEAIGEMLNRGDYSWVNVNDGTNSIGIWMKTEDAQKIGVYGDYKHKGDTIRVTGIYSSSCSEHGGDVDIHCSSLTVLQKGTDLNEPVSSSKLLIAMLLIVITSGIGFIYLKVMKKPESL